MKICTFSDKGIVTNHFSHLEECQCTKLYFLKEKIKFELHISVLQ